MEPLVNGMYDTELEYEILNPNKPIQCGICDCTYNVYAQCLIEKGTQFGPFQAKKLFTLHPSIDFPLKIFTNTDDDLSEYFLDTSDENECSWMIFVGPASDFEEQNVICYQEGEYLYYGTVKDILPGEPLKVWYSPYYAAKMKKALLNPSISDETVEIGPVDVETLLKRKKNIMPRDLWSCKFCGKVEKELSVFALHLLVHYRAQLRRICAICKESFLSRQLLNKHLRFVHGNNLKKTTDSLKDAQIIVLNIKDKCDSKDISVGGPLLLNNITADSLDNSTLLLPQTDLSQFDLSGIENQNTLLENENLNLNVDNILNDNVKQLDHFNFEINEPEMEQLICDICLKSFIKLKSLVQHIEQHTGKYLCYECNRRHTKKELPQQFVCAVCNAILNSRKTYLKHAKSHEGQSYPCDICDKVFKRTDALKMETCEICNKKLKSKRLLKLHMETHRNDKPYKCQICQAEFKQRTNLTRHINKHTSRIKFESLFQDNIEFYYCPKCNKNMKLKSSLRRHMKMYHPDHEASCEIMKPKIGKLNTKKLSDEYVKDDHVLNHDIEEDESVMDLKQTIENMDFNTDEINHCGENNDINIEIDKILNNTDNLDNFLSESSDRIVESLINSAAKENQLNTVTNHYAPKEVCLSMPDLTDGDQEIKLGESAYILDNGTIVEPQKSSSKVVVYILDQDKFT
ncbi:hypothetical protein NQ314_010847 [Rhamnusium bicolor]|uniref:Uncharacterized protein n=1 Tax=Rhamnusium bicolor TaxID=1586634 RepID=A0AAV8XN24_9CUCU|nr:hypothetical protein NQ314_010847 [Rhamnusium bicolor]